MDSFFPNPAPEGPLHITKRDRESAKARTENLIRRFLAEYRRKERHNFERLAVEVKDICEAELHKSEIQAQVTCRAKDAGSLEKKIRQRNSMIREGYEDLAAIKKDIVDLAGVRIALYFPNHREAVEKERPERRSVKEERAAYVSRFTGYRAKHYRVSVLDDEMDEDLDIEKDVIEVQVVSMLAHTWAQVGHDLFYKQMSGSPSSEEERILDGLSGLIQVGEVLLNQLHDVYKARSTSYDKSFANKYELASFLAAEYFPNFPSSEGSFLSPYLPSEFAFGSLDFFFRFLTEFGYDNPKALIPVLQQLKDAQPPEGMLIHHFKSSKTSEDNLAAIVMEAILSRLDESAISAEAAKRMDRDAYRCNVIITTLSLLKDLFPPFSGWRNLLFSKQVPLSKKEAMLEGWKWLIMPGLKDVVDGKGELTDTEREVLGVPWSWLNSHSFQIVDFCFRISKLGVFAKYQELLSAPEITKMEMMLEILDVESGLSNFGMLNSIRIN
ncbi:hypothetical protein SLS56_002571 [Neofusicoccum ribis]|uniref:RelA/SpoT domain-containing protein n=1 Tax=Neofusicoccum ribis TaxID=45134 RepID=A0ABR3T341_9PEZI